MANSGRSWDQQVVDKKIFLTLSKDITKKDLAAVSENLGVPDGTLAAIKADNEGYHDSIVYNLLKKWWEMKGSEATNGVLWNALTSADRRDVAKNLREGKYSDGTGLEEATNISRQHVPMEILSDTPTSAETTSNVPCYRMSSTPRSKCLILSYDTYKRDAKKKMKTRSGNRVDEEKLLDIFGNVLKFDVTIERNLTLKDTEKSITEMSEEIHDGDCFVLFVCSHGSKKRFRTSDNGTMLLQDVLTPFKAEGCRSLAGKPKIFFFNTCRGRYRQDFVDLQADEDRGVGATTSLLLPNEADFCVVLSTVYGYKSYRHKRRGTYFVRSLYKCLKSNYKKLDLISILLLTNGDLIKVFQERTKFLLQNKPMSVSESESESEGEGEEDKTMACQLSTTIMTMSKLVYLANKNV